MTEPIKWSAAPYRTSWGASMRVADIEIDKDHTLTLYCEADQTSKIDAMFSEVERLRAELARLTTLRPANEWDGETYVLWWRDWDDAGWVIDSVSDSQESGWWTPVFDVSLPDVKETK
ncbi:hypothetical protein EBZ80_20845 [bacterium]|nr:hypothetical protein [bacterium]